MKVSIEVTGDTVTFQNDSRCSTWHDCLDSFLGILDAAFQCHIDRAEIIEYLQSQLPEEPTHDPL